MGAANECLDLTLLVWIDGDKRARRHKIVVIVTSCATRFLSSLKLAYLGLELSDLSVLVFIHILLGLLLLSQAAA